MTLQQEKAYWTALIKQMESGSGKYTQAWYDAKKQLKDVNADITEAEEEAAEAAAKAAEEEQKAAEEAAEAEKKAAEEAAEAKQKAAEEAAEAAKEALRTQATVLSSMLENYMVYYNVSAQAEAEYWDLARQQFAEGTEERLEMDQKYNDALEDLYDQRTALDEEYAENSKEINEELISSIEELQQAYEDAVESRKQDILSQMSLFEAWDSEGYDADTLLYNLKTQVAGLTFWEQQLEELSQKNVTEDLLEELRKMGPDAAASIYSLNQMTAEQLDEYVALWEQKNALATSQAVKENEELRQTTNQQIAELKQDAQEELNDLTTEYNAAVKTLTTGLSDELKTLVAQSAQIGEDAVYSLIASIQETTDSSDTSDTVEDVVATISDTLSELEQAGEIIGKNTLDGILEGLLNTSAIADKASEVVEEIKESLQEAADIHSPSKLFRDAVGEPIIAGIAAGMSGGTDQAAEASRDAVMQALDAAKEEISRQQLELTAALPDYSGMASLNRMMDSYGQQATTVNVDNSSVLSAMENMMALMQEMTDKMVNLQVVLDTGKTVGALQPAMSEAIADAALRSTRGGVRK